MALKPAPELTVTLNLTETLRKLEADLQAASVRGDPAHLDRLLAEGFREFGSSGRSFSRAGTIAELRAEFENEQTPEFTMHNFEVTLLSEEIALVTYRAEKALPDTTPVASLRSSLWTYRAGAWQILFHQGTTIPDLPPQSRP